jgi:hypothetical protein
MRTIETTLEHIAHAVADEYRCENGHKDFKPMKMMKWQSVSSKQQ